MFRKNIREFETLPNRDDERADNGNERQLQISRIEETNQKTLEPTSIKESRQSQVGIDKSASTSRAINVSLNVGKLHFYFISI